MRPINECQTSRAACFELSLGEACKLDGEQGGGRDWSGPMCHSPPHFPPVYTWAALKANKGLEAAQRSYFKSWDSANNS